jgi:hypothetical protein
MYVLNHLVVSFSSPVHLAHFGFGPSKVRFWAHPSVPHYIRMFPANPEPSLSDKLDPTGSEWQSPAAGAVSMVLRVEKQYAKTMMETIRTDMEEIVRNREAKGVPNREDRSVDVWKRITPRGSEIQVPPVMPRL